MTTISIVDDDAKLCHLLTKALTGAMEIEVVSTHSRGEEALLEIPLRRPDVVLMDIKLPGMTGIECIRRLRRVHPKVPSRILVLSDYEDNPVVFDALKAGADGYLSKDRISTAELSEAIKHVASGGASMTPNIARKVLDHFRRPNPSLGELSSREMEVLDNLAEGLLYKQIGSKLDISLDTVRGHVKSIYDKLHVHSRTEATARYLRSQ